MSTDQQWDIVTGVGLTALAVAAGRAAESQRRDALISDPYAQRLVAAAHSPKPLPTSPDQLAESDGGGSPESEERWSSATRYMGLRTRVFDDYFAEATGQGLTQVVILASGLDTRPFRLPWPSGTTCFELDQPAVIDYKLGVLREEGATPACDHRPVRIDLRDDWGTALEKAGFDRSRPSVWLAEGLLPYLPPEAETRLFEEITRLSCSGSRLSVEQVNDIAKALDDPSIQDTADKIGVDLPSLFPEGARETVDTQLSRMGWKLRHVPAGEAAARYGRSMHGVGLFTERMVHTFGELP